MDPMKICCVTWNTSNCNTLPKVDFITDILVISLQECYKPLENFSNRFKYTRTFIMYGFKTIVCSNVKLELKVTRIGLGPLGFFNKGAIITNINNEVTHINAHLSAHFENNDIRVYQIKKIISLIPTVSKTVILTGDLNFRMNYASAKYDLEKRLATLNNLAKLKQIELQSQNQVQRKTDKLDSHKEKNKMGVLATLVKFFMTYKTKDLEKRSISISVNALNMIIRAMHVQKLKFIQNSEIIQRDRGKSVYKQEIDKIESNNPKTIATYFYDPRIDQIKKVKKMYPEFKEAAIRFLPTFKYKGNYLSYLRSPSYCDRILVASLYSVVFKDYYTLQDICSSDHKPVICCFEIGCQPMKRTLKLLAFKPMRLRIFLTYFYIALFAIYCAIYDHKLDIFILFVTITS